MSELWRRRRHCQWPLAKAVRLRALPRPSQWQMRGLRACWPRRGRWGTAAVKADMIAAAAKAVHCAQYLADVWTIDGRTDFEKYAADLERASVRKRADADGAAVVAR